MVPRCRYSTRPRSETLLHPTSTKKHGFTLIELLVVIAIISLLVSILVPSLQKARELTRQVICQTRLKSIGSVYFLYQNDNDDRGPMGFTYGYDTARPPGWSGWDANEGNPYESGYGWFRKQALGEYLGLTTHSESKLPMSCTNADAEDLVVNHGKRTSYSVNAYLGYDTHLGDHVDAMASTPMLMDGAGRDILGNPANVRVYSLAFPANVFGWSSTAQDLYFLEFASFCHNGSANFLFFDGHAENQKTLETLEDYKQLWTWWGH